MLTLDLRFVEALWPLVTRMARAEDCPDELWSAMGAQASLGPVLENVRLDEEQGRPLHLNEWRSVWEAAANIRRTPLVGGRRQEYVLTNARFALQNAEALDGLIRHLTANLADITLRVVKTAAENLPSTARCATEIHLVAGTASGGFTDETGVYVDVAVFGALGANQKLTEQFLSHELWHSGHWSLIERHAHVDASWFLPIAQLQSEGIVNFLIGGTYELHAYKVTEGQEDEKQRANRFLAYADSMEAEATVRIERLYSEIGRLLEGNIRNFRQFSDSLPEPPGYLHGKYMARTIDSALGRDALLATCSDPVWFLLEYVRACEHLGTKAPSESVCDMLRNL